MSSHRTFGGGELYQIKMLFTIERDKGAYKRWLSNETCLLPRVRFQELTLKKEIGWYSSMTLNFMKKREAETGA